MQNERDRHDQDVEIGEDLTKSLTHERDDLETEPPEARITPEQEPESNSNEEE